MRSWVPSLAQKKILLWMYAHEGDVFGEWENAYEILRPGEIHEKSLLKLEKEGMTRRRSVQGVYVGWGEYDLTTSGQREVAAMLAQDLPSPPSENREPVSHGKPKLLTPAQERGLVRIGNFVHALGLPGSVRIPAAVHWQTLRSLGERGMIDRRNTETKSTTDGMRERQPDSDAPAYLMTSRGLTYFYGLTQQPAWNFRVWVAARGVVLEHVTGLDLRQAYDTVAELNATRPVDGFLRAFYERI